MEDMFSELARHLHLEDEAVATAKPSVKISFRQQPKYEGIATLCIMEVRSRDLKKLQANFYPLESSPAIVPM